MSADEHTARSVLSDRLSLVTYLSFTARRALEGMPGEMNWPPVLAPTSYVCRTGNVQREILYKNLLILVAYLILRRALERKPGEMNWQPVLAPTSYVCRVQKQDDEFNLLLAWGSDIY